MEHSWEHSNGGRGGPVPRVLALSVHEKYTLHSVMMFTVYRLTPDFVATCLEPLEAISGVQMHNKHSRSSSGSSNRNRPASSPPPIVLSLATWNAQAFNRSETKSYNCEACNYICRHSTGFSSVGTQRTLPSLCDGKTSFAWHLACHARGRRAPSTHFRSAHHPAQRDTRSSCSTLATQNHHYVLPNCPAWPM